MIGKEILSKKQVSLTQVKEILKEKSEKKELNYEQKVTFEYAKKFAKVTPSKEESLFKELTALDLVNEEFALKVIDLAPDELSVLKTLVPKGVTIKEQDLETILSLVKKYAK